MSKKINKIANMIFYAQQNPKALATLIAEGITDVVTSIGIIGATSINIPDTGSVTEEYKATALSQFGDGMSDAVTLALEGTVTGVSISDSTVTVDNTVTDDSFVLKATCGSVTQLMTIALV